jgi:chitinase
VVLAAGIREHLRGPFVERETMMMRFTRSTFAVVAFILAAWLVGPTGGVAAGPLPPDTTPPTTPTNLRVVDLSFNEVKLAWDAATDDSGGLTYETELNALPDDLQRWGALETTRTYTVEQGLTYTASVWAVDGAHNMSAPATIQFTTPVDAEPPSVPTNLRFEVRQGFPRGVIAWDASVDNSSSITYDVYREIGSGLGPLAHPRGLFVSVGDLLDRLVIEPGQTYTFVVQARDVANNVSPLSAPLTMTF